MIVAISKFGRLFTANCTGEEKLSEHLKIKEVWNNSASEEIKLVLNDDSFRAIRCWEHFRALHGRPIQINSGYRTASFNAKIGGIENSLHRDCCAFDNAISYSKTDELIMLSWMDEICAAYDMEAELGFYPWGVHTGFKKQLPYKHSGRVYVFDRR